MQKTKERVQLGESCCNSYETRMFHPESYDETLEDYLEKENFFFSTRKHQGYRLGIGVYEVENSIDDIDSYKFFSCTINTGLKSESLDFKNVDEYTFTYSRKAQELLSSVLLAENACDYGMKMTIYCGILEHLSEDGKKTLVLLMYWID